MGTCAYCFRRRQRVPALLLLAAVLLYGAAGNLHLGAALMARLEARVPAPDPARLQPFDAVCVLGGGSEADAFGRPQLGTAGDRLRVAAGLWHGGQAQLLVASGASRDGALGNRNLGEETRELWHQMGVPDQAILVVTEPCWNTRDEVAAYRALRDRYGWRRMALVSSASHLPRALALAQRAGLAVEPLGADWRGRPHAATLPSWIPQEEGFMTIQRACWEYLGRWVGR
jgi:uncharacterized SAM-binding protein YcdF (DUF218 family)